MMRSRQALPPAAYRARRRRSTSVARRRKFDQMIAVGRMPGPKRIDGRKIWDRQKLDAAFAALPDDDTPNPWDAVA